MRSLSPFISFNVKTKPFVYGVSLPPYAGFQGQVQGALGENMKAKVRGQKHGRFRAPQAPQLQPSMALPMAWVLTF